MTRIYRSLEAKSAVEADYRVVLDQWPIPHEEYRIATRQGETFVVASGPLAAPPLVLFHGAQSNSAAWMLDVALWSAAFRVYAVDRIGDAGFSASSRHPLAGDDYALWLDDVMSNLGLQTASFVRVSLGGWLALDYAKRRPGKVNRLALVCPAGIGRQKNFLLRVAPLLLLGAWGQRKVRELVFGPEPISLPTAVRPIAALMRLIGQSVIPWSVSIPRLDDTELQALDLPMLVIVGGKDVLIDSRETRLRLARHVPSADVHYLPDARHYIPDQAATLFAFLTAQ